jgi:hypothetical protein
MNDMRLPMCATALVGALLAAPMAAGIVVHHDRAALDGRSKQRPYKNPARQAAPLQEPAKRETPRQTARRYVP